MEVPRDQGRGSTRHTQPWQDLVRETAAELQCHRTASVAKQGG